MMKARKNILGQREREMGPMELGFQVEKLIVKQEKRVLLKLKQHPVVLVVQLVKHDTKAVSILRRIFVDHRLSRLVRPGKDRALVRQCLANCILGQ